MLTYYVYAALFQNKLRSTLTKTDRSHTDNYHTLTNYEYYSQRINFMQTIYIENDLLHHPVSQRILQGFGRDARVITCRHYGEVFNPKAQNFRLQKQQQALILAAGTRPFSVAYTPWIWHWW